MGAANREKMKIEGLPCFSFYIDKAESGTSLLRDPSFFQLISVQIIKFFFTQGVYLLQKGFKVFNPFYFHYITCSYQVVILVFRDDQYSVIQVFPGFTICVKCMFGYVLKTFNHYMINFFAHLFFFIILRHPSHCYIRKDLH